LTVALLRHANDRNRRIIPVPARSGGGRLTERTPAVQPRRREWVKVPLKRPCRRDRGTARSGGKSPFVQPFGSGSIGPLTHVRRRLAHSITSSARARSDCGTVRPSAFAVFKLITSSNVVGCWTGRSLGSRPLGDARGTPPSQACEGDRNEEGELIVARSFRACSADARFAVDSPLEGDGFELSVPRSG
jgi:hypothetical protein